MSKSEKEFEDKNLDVKMSAHEDDGGEFEDDSNKGKKKSET